MSGSNLPVRRTKKSQLLNKLKQKSGQVEVGKIKAHIKSTPTKLKAGEIGKTIARSSVPRLLLAMDATASREPCWSMATEITEGMFLAVPNELEIGLCYHGGSKVRELTEFTTEKEKFKDLIRNVTCLAGATAFNEIIERSLLIHRLKIIIYIGDCYEENLESVLPMVQHLALKGIRLFIFHDTTDAGDYDLPFYLNTARVAFEKLTDAGRGAVFPFDVNSPEIVRSLLEAIAYYSARGLTALKRLDTPGAKKLLQAVKD